jgi:hypothetical protein
MSAFHKVVEMPHLPTNLHRETVRRHLTGSWKIFTGYATITDGINPLVYFKQEYFFWRAISVCKTICNCFFFTDRLSNGIRYYRQKVSRWTLSVGKKNTDELWITDRQNISISKTVKSCSRLDLSVDPIQIEFTISLTLWPKIWEGVIVSWPSGPHNLDRANNHWSSRQLFENRLKLRQANLEFRWLN